MKKFSDFKKFVREKAHKWASGNDGETAQVPAEPSEERAASLTQGSQEGFPEKALLSAFDHACDIIEQENLLLQNDAPMEAIGLLAHKTAAIETLRTMIENVQNLPEKPETLSEALLEAQKRFSEITEQNSALLKKSLHTQSVVMRILADAAVKDAQQSYNQTGTMVMDHSRTLGAFNNKI